MQIKIERHQEDEHRDDGEERLKDGDEDGLNSHSPEIVQLEFSSDGKSDEAQGDLGKDAEFFKPFLGNDVDVQQSEDRNHDDATDDVAGDVGKFAEFR